MAYLYSFVLFVRFFSWRQYANAQFWARKVDISLEDFRFIAKRSGVGLPFFTIMVPARNESLVIGKTIENLMKLDYDKNSCEIIIITDEKERQEHERIRPVVVSELLGILESRYFEPKESHTPLFFLAYIISNLPLGELLFQYSNLDLRAAKEASALKMRRLIFAFCSDLMTGKPTDLSTLIYSLRRAMPKIPDEQLETLASELLLLSHLSLSEISLKLPKYVQSAKNCQLIAQSCGMQSSQRTEYARRTQLEQIISDGENPSHESLTQLYNSFFLTTQEVVESCIAQFEGNGFRLKHVEVPYDFDGAFGGECVGYPIKSTKGRALNYTFSKVDPQTSMIVFYDAESHPDHNVLLHAGRHLLAKDPPDILQGPLFQVRNYYRMGALSKIGGLYKAIAHDWYLPLLVKKLPFVGGTNLFISWSLIKKMRGFDENSLTEDLEFGCRAHLYFGTRLVFLPVKSTEQTPPTIAQYFRQRLRWGSGHLEVMRRIVKKPMIPGTVGTIKDFKARARNLWWNLLVSGPLEWILYQLCTAIVLVMDIILIANVFGAGIPGPFFAENQMLYWTLVGLNVPYLGFTFYCYVRYDEVFDKSFKPRTALSGMLDFVKLFIASFVVFILPAPYTWAVVLAVSGRSPQVWVKTPRTAE